MSVTTRNSYLESLLAGQPQLPASPLAWLNRLRADAVDRVGALTVPTTRDEEWRFTDLSPLTRIPFQPARSAPRLELAYIERFILPEAAARLAFVDGVYAPQLSSNPTAIGVTTFEAGAGARGREGSARLHRARRRRASPGRRPCLCG